MVIQAATERGGSRLGIAGYVVVAGMCGWGLLCSRCGSVMVGCGSESWGR
jgi:hypothetical protein